MCSPKNAVFYHKRECDYTCSHGKMAMETMKMRRDCEGHLIEMDLNKHAHSIQTYRKHVGICAYHQHGSAGAFVLKLYRVRLNKANTGYMIWGQTDSIRLDWILILIRAIPVANTRGCNFVSLAIGTGSTSAYTIYYMYYNIILFYILHVHHSDRDDGDSLMMRLIQFYSLSLWFSNIFDGKESML